MMHLIERLEQASGPSRNLDEAIELWLCGNPEGVSLTNMLYYTYSIDAALTLVPEGLNYVLKARNPGAKSEARVGGPQGGFIIKEGEHFSPAIALCIAALKARAAVDAKDKP